MPVNDRAQRAAEFLWNLGLTGGHVARLPDELRPATRAEGYAIQACLEGFSARPLFGWKIAATSLAGQQHIQVDGPLAGRLLAERIYAPGATVPLEGNRMMVAEAEFAFRMATDLAPQVAPRTRAEVMAAVASLHPAIEVPNSRFAPFEQAGAAQLIADNACAEYFLLGAAAPEAWHGIELARHELVARDGAGQMHAGIGANALGDPAVALTWIANELSSIGVTLKAGQVVTTGTCVKPFAIGAGDHVTIDFGVIGSIDAHFGRA
jgi:2-keto-4-pentenoate hydratase